SAREGREVAGITRQARRAIPGRYQKTDLAGAAARSRQFSYVISFYKSNVITLGERDADTTPAAGRGAGAGPGIPGSPGAPGAGRVARSGYAAADYGVGQC